MTPIQNGSPSVDFLASSTSAFDSLMGKIKPSNFNQRRNYSTIDISADKWLMSYDADSLQKLENPPSLADGLSRELEKETRYLGCELIQSGAILLSLPQTAAATGQILFQRYYYQKSFVRYDFQHTVMACLLLASKIEEEPRRPRDVLNVYNRLKQILMHRPHNAERKKFTNIELGNKEYITQKVAVIKAERRILNALGFVVHVHHPHKFIYVFMHVLQLLSKEDSNKDLLQKAWNYMNDGLRTDMFLRYTPETIACACIHLASRTVSKPIVLPKQPFPWFELFDASDRDVKSACSMIVELYSRKRPPNFMKISQELSILSDRIQLQMRPEPIIEKSLIVAKVVIEKKAAQIDLKLDAILHKHTEKPFEKDRANGKSQIEDRGSENNRYHRVSSLKRSHSREDRRRRERSRSKERLSGSRPRSRSRGKSHSKKYDDRDRKYETKKRRDK